jgi:hypothetical protein
MKMGGFFGIFTLNFTVMASILIQSDNSEDMDLIVKLAKKLGIQVNDISDEVSEDLTLGKVMTKLKTGTSVSRDSIMKKLRS